jgi:hypothetical protein
LKLITQAGAWVSWGMSGVEVCKGASAVMGASVRGLEGVTGFAGNF